MGPQNENGETTPPHIHDWVLHSLTQVSAIVPFLKLTDFLHGMEFYVSLFVKWSWLQE